MTDNSTLQIGQKVIVGWTNGTRRVLLSGRSETAPGSLGNSLFGEEVAQYAAQFVGVPYQWGGESASGFDCSGLVQFSFGHFGISLSRSSYDMFQEGTAISRSDLVPGDLVFFNSDGGGASHVGIYMGGDRFVNAEASGVRIDSLDSAYWSEHYIGARRVH